MAREANAVSKPRPQLGRGELPEQKWNKGFWAYFEHGRVFSSLLQYVARYFFLPPRARSMLQAWRGVHFVDRKSVFVGFNVLFDELFPQNIRVGSNVYITEGTKILTHLYDSSFARHTFRKGRVTIGNNVFIGYDVIIAGDLTIGEGAVIGAGAVVTSDVAPNAVMVGVPARCIKYRGSSDPRETHRSNTVL